MQRKLISQIGKVIIKIFDLLEFMLGILLIIGLIFMILITFGQVLLRYIFRSPTRWAEELVRYIAIWITFLGCPILIRKRDLISIEMVRKRLPKKLRISLLFLLDLVVFYFLFYFIQGGFGLTQHAFRTLQLTPALRLPIGYVYLALPIGGILMVLFQFEATIKMLDKFFKKPTQQIDGSE